jgi:hypothetical protein
MKLGQPSVDPIKSLIATMRRFPQLRDAFGNARNAPSAQQLTRWHSEASDGKCISVVTLAEIVGCKNASGPGAARIAEQAGANDESEVRRQTELAFSMETLAGAAIGALCSLQGVGVATASAVLSWCYPDRYAVIDWRVWETLHLFGLTDAVRGPGQCSADDYAWYMDQVTALCADLGSNWTPQKVDRWLYSFSKCQFTPEHFS